MIDIVGGEDVKMKRKVESDDIKMDLCNWICCPRMCNSDKSLVTERYEKVISNNSSFYYNFGHVNFISFSYG